MNYRKKVSILGCGWVGNALKELLEKQGNTVHCLSRETKLNISAMYYNVDVLIIAIPPSTQEYLDVLDDTMYYLNKQKQPQVIFLSSISFYDAKPSVLESEAHMQQLCDDVVILRLGGLMGYDRVAGKYTAGKVLTSDSRTNYIHRDDVVGIIERMIRQEVRGEVFDVVAPIQSTKKPSFHKMPKSLALKRPSF